jgi:hypothetical protein
MHVRLSDSLTEELKSQVGVRQGDILSPNLLKLFLNDLPKCFDEKDDQVLLGNTYLSCLLYADDLV